MGKRERHALGGASSQTEPQHRPMMLRVEGFLERRSPGFVILVGLLLTALIGLVDAVTGTFDVSIFYLVPIALVTFARGRWMGALMAGVATLARMGAEVARGVTSIDSPVAYWSALSRFYVFMVVVLMIAPMRDALVWQRELAVKEAEAAERLRALNELKDALQHEDLSDVGQLAALSELRDSLARLDDFTDDAAVASN